MNDRTYLWTYVFTLIAGILLLVFCNSVNLFRIIIIIIGACLLIPSTVMLFRGFAGKKMPDGRRVPHPWYTGVGVIFGLSAGELLIVRPEFFVNYLIYTLGILLIFVGVIQVINLVSESKTLGKLPVGWYVIPWLTIIGGIVVTILGPDRIAEIASIITGILLILYSLNGIVCEITSGGKRRIGGN